MNSPVKSITFKEGIDRIIREFKLPGVHGRGALAEAENLPNEILPVDWAGREDLSGETVVTIDGETAKDFDDAVSITRLPSGYRLKVSIADVSHFVPPGSWLDREAYIRGTSSYFPDRCLPMFPEKLSNNLCSLLPETPRLTVTAEMDLDEQGLRIGSRLYRSVIQSRARMTYTDVKKIIEDRDPSLRSKYHEICPSLDLMATLAVLMQKKRFDRGSLDFDLPEPEIILDLEKGGVEEILRAERNVAHRLIEEFMIAANETVAEFITENKVPMIYRVHDGPSSDRIEALKIVFHNLGFPVALGKRVTPKTFSGALVKIRGRPEERLLGHLLIRSMGRAVYATRNTGHFGLASTCYTHFTSPIRRYPDLAVHRVLMTLLEGAERGKGYATRDKAGLEEIARHSSIREEISMKSEWASRDLAAGLLMGEKIGEEFSGRIAGITQFGFFVELDPYLVQGLVSMRSLKDDFYLFRKNVQEIVGRRTKRRYRLGDPIHVVVESVNLEKRWVDFRPAKSVPA